MGRPCLLTFVLVDRPHVVLQRAFSDLLLPEWCSRLPETVRSARPARWFGWVETRYVG